MNISGYNFIIIGTTVFYTVVPSILAECCFFTSILCLLVWPWWIVSLAWSTLVQFHKSYFTQKRFGRPLWWNPSTKGQSLRVGHIGHSTPKSHCRIPTGPLSASSLLCNPRHPCRASPLSMDPAFGPSADFWSNQRAWKRGRPWTQHSTMPGCAWATEVRSSWDLLEDQRTFLETDRYKTSYLLHVSLERFECVFDRRIIFSKANISFFEFSFGN